MTPEQWAACQGLPPKRTDEATLAHVARLALDKLAEPERSAACDQRRLGRA